MGWFDRVRNLMRVRPAGPPQSPSPLGYASLFVPANVRVSDYEATSAGAVWACIRKLVDPVASSEFKVFTRDVKGDREQLDDDLIAWLFNVRPNPELTAQAFKELVLTQAIVHGDGFAQIVRDGAGRVIELWPLDSNGMRVGRDPESGELVALYRNPFDAKEYVFPYSQILHVRGPVTDPTHSAFRGDSLVHRAMKAIALAVAQERFATNYYSNNAVLGGVLKAPPGRAYTPEQVERLRATFDAEQRGVDNSHKVRFLDGGFEYQQFTTDAEKSQLIESRTFSVEEVARYFGVPLVMLGVQASAQGYGTNVSQLQLHFARETLTPWVNRLTEEIVFKLYPQRTPWREIEIDLSWLTMGNEIERAQAAQVWITAGVKTVNEVRRQEGLNDIEGGDEPTWSRTAPAPEPKQDAPSDPAQEDPTPPADPKKGEAAANLVTDLLTRFNARFRAAKEDEERAKATERTHGDLRNVLTLVGMDIEDRAIRSALDSVTAGVEPLKAAAHLLDFGKEQPCH